MQAGRNVWWIEVVLVVELSRIPLTLLKKGIRGPVRECLLLTFGLVIDVRHKIIA